MLLAATARSAAPRAEAEEEAVEESEHLPKPLFVCSSRRRGICHGGLHGLAHLQRGEQGWHGNELRQGEVVTA